MSRHAPQAAGPSAGKIAGLIAVIVLALGALVWYATSSGSHRTALEVPAANQAENDRPDHGAKGGGVPEPRGAATARSQAGRESEGGGH